MWACRMDHIEHFELLTAVDHEDEEEEDGYERDLSGRTWMHWSVRRTEPLECLKVIILLLKYPFIYGGCHVGRNVRCPMWYRWPKNVWVQES